MNQRTISAATLAVMVLSTVAPSLALANEDSVRANGSARLFQSIRASVKAEINADVKDLRRVIQIDRKEEKKDEKDERASKSQEFKDNKEAKLTENRKKQIKNWWARVAKRLGNIIEQEKKFSTRVEKRLDTLAARGVNVTKPRADLAAARVKMDIAAQGLASASLQVDTILSTNTPAEALPKLRDLHKSVIAKIRAAHKALVDVVVEIKVLPSPSPTVSPTVSPTATP